MSRHQLRVYQLASEGLEPFLEVFPRIVAARRAYGMDVVGAWVDRENNRFVWVVSGPDDFEAAVRAYMAGPERSTMRPEPSDFIAEMDVVMVEPVEQD